MTSCHLPLTPPQQLQVQKASGMGLLASGWTWLWPGQGMELVAGRAAPPVAAVAAAAAAA